MSATWCSGASRTWCLSPALASRDIENRALFWPRRRVLHPTSLRAWGALGDALAAFFEVLDRMNLADLIRPKRRLSALLRLDPAA